MYGISLCIPLYHQENVSMKCISPHTTLLYSKTWVYSGIWGAPIGLIVAPKHRLLVLVRTTSVRQFKPLPTIYVLSKNTENIQQFHCQSQNILYNAWACIGARYKGPVRPRKIHTSARIYE